MIFPSQIEAKSEREQQHDALLVMRHEGCGGKNEISVIEHPAWSDTCVPPSPIIHCRKVSRA